MNYDQMTVAQLGAELERLTAARAALRDEGLKVHAALDRKQAAVAVQRTLDGMSDVERVALAQLVQTHGVVSGEQVVGF